jgi:hypothetical protein
MKKSGDRFGFPPSRVVVDQLIGLGNVVDRRPSPTFNYGRDTLDFPAENLPAHLATCRNS